MSRGTFLATSDDWGQGPGGFSQKLNLLSWYLFATGGCIELGMMIFGGVDTGWTFTTPLSTHYLNTNVISAAMGIFHCGLFLRPDWIELHCHHPQNARSGMTWFRLPLFIWSYYATSIIFCSCHPGDRHGMVLIVLERVIGIGIFDSNT